MFPTRHILLSFAAGFILSVLMYPLWHYSEPDSPMAHTRRRIVAFGDSLTERGFRADGQAGWVSLLSDWYGRKADVLNRGYSGYNTRWASKLTTGLLQSTDPDLMIVFFGANDASLDIAPQSILLQEYENNLRAIVKEIKNSPNANSLNDATPSPRGGTEGYPFGDL